MNNRRTSRALALAASHAFLDSDRLESRVPAEAVAAEEDLPEAAAFVPDPNPLRYIPPAGVCVFTLRFSCNGEEIGGTGFYLHADGGLQPGPLPEVAP
jgi:hypothetical protein